MNIDVVIVSCKTPNLIEVAIKRFVKFCTSNFNLKFIILSFLTVLLIPGCGSDSNTLDDKYRGYWKNGKFRFIIS